MSGILDNIYRVSTYRTGVVVLSLGAMGSVANGHYDCVKDLPMWMQERLAVLRKSARATIRLSLLKVWGVAS